MMRSVELPEHGAHLVCTHIQTPFLFSLGLLILLQNTHCLSSLDLCAKLITETYTGGEGRTKEAEHNEREKDTKTHNSKTGPPLPYTLWNKQG